MGKKRFLELDFIRAVSAVMIVCYHFTCACHIFELQGFVNLVYEYANGNWGETAVCVFFMLSGAALLYNYQGKPIDGKEYAKKRWLALFPMFYLMWIIMYIREAILRRNWFWGGKPVLILLSVLGFDGYFYYLKPNYHMIGEWFLGAIIIVYAFFPLLKSLFERFRWGTTAFLGVLWILVLLHPGWFRMDPIRNPVTCISLFWIGMLLMEYREYLHKMGTGLACAAGLLFMAVCRLPVSQVIGMSITAVFLFGLLFWSGQYVMRSSLPKKIIQSVGRNSYGIFLTHHVIIDNWVKTERYGVIGRKKNLVWLAAALVLAYLTAVLLRKASEALREVIRKRLFKAA